MRLWWRYHKVAPGDTLASVAHTYRTTPKAIAQANNLEGGEDLQTESKLVIPIAPGKHATTEDGARFFRDVDSLVALARGLAPAEWDAQRTVMKAIAMRRYRWERIAGEYAALFRRLLDPVPSRKPMTVAQEPHRP